MDKEGKHLWLVRSAELVVQARPARAVCRIPHLSGRIRLPLGHFGVPCQPKHTRESRNATLDVDSTAQGETANTASPPHRPHIVLAKFKCRPRHSQWIDDQQPALAHHIDAHQYVIIAEVQSNP